MPKTLHWRSVISVSLRVSNSGWFSHKPPKLSPLIPNYVHFHCFISGSAEGFDHIHQDQKCLSMEGRKWQKKSFIFIKASHAHSEFTGNSQHFNSNQWRLWKKWQISRNVISRITKWLIYSIFCCLLLLWNTWHFPFSKLKTLQIQKSPKERNHLSLCVKVSQAKKCVWADCP